ncbi:MAG: DUF1835 domain-containing protein, partial [Sinomicrobium sp.]|nr:DUF1835 domain-containing protein [Sinomicrobium sp.]
TTKKRFIATLKEYRNLCNQKTQDEVVLWFDHDLFCQINMIAVLSWFRNHKKNIQISLVSGLNNDNSGDWHSLSELSPEALLYHYENRIHLTEDDVDYADYIWQLYCGGNPIRLETFSKFNSSQFHYLPDAIKAHILRFPTVKNGLNKIENDILATAADCKPESREALVKQMLQKEKIYGFTDLQYTKIIERLKSLFQSLDPVKLNETGEALLHNAKNYYSFMKNDDEYMGGSRKYSFLYHSPSGKLLKL